jgi:uncharacterized protein
MAPKEFVTANDLARDSFALAKKIYDSGFRPDSLLVLWRGGTPVGIFIHEFLLYKGVRTYHSAVKAESYTGIDERVEPCIDNLDGFLDRLTPSNQVLVVDDIFDTGCTLNMVRDILNARTRNVRIATLYYKIGTSRVDLVPDYYMRMTDRWIFFPHELMGLTPAEIQKKDEFVWRLLHGESC